MFPSKTRLHFFTEHPIVHQIMFIDRHFIPPYVPLINETIP